MTRIRKLPHRLYKIEWSSRTECGKRLIAIDTSTKPTFALEFLGMDPLNGINLFVITTLTFWVHLEMQK